MHCPHAEAGLGEAHVTEAFGNTKVGHLHKATLVNKDVLRLNVPVYQTVLVRVVERCSDLPEDVDGFIEREGSSFQDQSFERRAGHVFHDDVARAIIPADVVDADNVGMAESCRGLGFTLEPAEEARVGSELPAENLDRDGAIEYKVVTAVDDRHTAFADRFVEPVTGIQDPCLHAMPPLPTDEKALPASGSLPGLSYYALCLVAPKATP